MSNYGASGSGPVPGPGPNGLAPFDDLDLLQGRRQQQQQGLHSGNLTVGGNTSAIPGGMAGARGRPPDFSQHHLNLLQHQQQHHHDPSAAAANSPFSYSNNNNSNTVGVRGGGAPGHHLHASPYTRMTNPYAAIADVRAAAAYGGGGMGPSGTPQGATASADAVAQLYAAQQRRAQLTNSYGYNNSAAGVVGGGGGGAPASRQALEHHYAAYGNMAGGTPLPGLYGHEYGHDLSYSAQSAAHDASLQQQQQHHHHHNHQQQMQDAYGHSMPKPPMSYHSPDGTGGGETMMGHDPSSSQHSMERYHHHGGTNSRKQHKLSSRSSPGSNRSKDGKQRKPMLQKVTSTINKAKSSSRVLVKDGVTVIEDGNNTWYTGCIPLGVEDDKYWLSELQVFLRSNFAEAFGATEEDIAAPMHGRNKPIALGQVGIRCLHCKGTFVRGSFLLLSGGLFALVYFPIV